MYDPVPNQVNQSFHPSGVEAFVKCIPVKGETLILFILFKLEAIVTVVLSC